MNDKQTNKNKILNILGCWPERLNMVFELANEARGFKSFNILKNIPTEFNEYYMPNKKWKVNVINCYETSNKFNPNDYYAFSVVGTKSKEIVFDYFKRNIQMENKQLINLIHPTAYISSSTKLNFGSQIKQLSSISVLSTLGFGVNIKQNCHIGHHCNIGDFVTINPGVTISGFVNVGKKTMIGSGSTIKENIKIGENSIIGMGSVVVKDIPDNVVAYGNPCRVHRLNN